MNMMEKRQNKYKVIISGGGTGGHVFPAISIANALKEKLTETDFLFVGAIGKMEMEKVPEAGYKIIGLPVAGFQRRITWKNVAFFFKLLKSMQMAKKLVSKFNPDIAIGVGGYASGPVVKAAAKKKIPVLIQEQNSYAGMTNRMLSKSAEKICVAYEGMDKYFPAEKIILTGNPIRQNLVLTENEKGASIKHFGLKSDQKVVLIIGGSLGAGSLNNSIIKELSRIAESDIQLLWQCGKYYYEKAQLALQNYSAENIILLPFIKEMSRAYQVADVIVSRAGAGTISELCLVGKPVILVPSPNVTENHQMSNAKALSKVNAAELIPDNEVEKELLKRILNLTNDQQRRNELSENIKKLSIPDAADRIAAEVKNILDK